MTCSVEDCERSATRRGWCKRHYERWARHGDPTATKWIQPGDVCSVEDCDLPVKSRGWCNMHYTRWRMRGTTDRYEKRGRFVAGDEITYGGIHLRVRSIEGPASARPCTMCPAQARDWAYDHADPNERIDPRRGLPFSLDPSHYMPLCRRCHRNLDRSAA